MPDYREILLDISEGIATITLNRPEKMNAYTVSMGEELRDAIDRTDADDAVRAVIFTGAGERAFCAGTDLSPEGKDVPFASDDEIADLSDPRARDYGGLLTLRLFQSKKPLISACNGAAVGVGATIQLAMDMRLASVKARYGFVFTRRGISPDAAASWFLPRVVGRPQALEWAMTGRVFDAPEALRGGLVRSLHEPAELMPAARALAREIAENTAPVSVALTRAMLWRDAELGHPMLAHRIDSRVIYRRSRSGDAAEGVASFFEKRAPSFPDTVSADMPDVWPWWDEPDWE
jgi:enoyl-CoA hydratase/carnithine racemase